MDWNIKLFFKINQLIGKNKWLDVFGRAGGEFVIFFSLAWYFVSVFIKFYPNRIEIFLPIVFLGSVWFIGLGVSQLIGLLVKEKRPKLTFPDTKQLFEPISSWKSFPSDHTMAVFIIFFLSLIFSLPFAWVLLVMALWTAWGRAYGGVHYPLDIIGGFLLAGLMGVSAWCVYLIVF